MRATSARTDASVHRDWSNMTNSSCQVASPEFSMRALSVQPGLREIPSSVLIGGDPLHLVGCYENLGVGRHRHCPGLVQDVIVHRRVERFLFGWIRLSRNLGDQILPLRGVPIGIVWT